MGDTRENRGKFGDGIVFWYNCLNLIQARSFWISNFWSTLWIYLTPNWTSVVIISNSNNRWKGYTTFSLAVEIIPSSALTRGKEVSEFWGNVLVRLNWDIRTERFSDKIVKLMFGFEWYVIDKFICHLVVFLVILLSF